VVQREAVSLRVVIEIPSCSTSTVLIRVKKPSSMKTETRYSCS